MGTRRVDWPTVLREGVARLGAMAGALDNATEAELAGFLASRPDVSSYAALCATEEVPPRVYELGQWLAECSLARLTNRLHAAGMRLALDLPVGSRPGGWEQLRWPASFTGGATIGAPPDAFFEAGQDWGLPPPDPIAARRDGHRMWHDLLSNAARHADVLRIDHVMQVLRLWWVPDGESATHGTYVSYPAEELLAVAALVAHRSGTVMVGEDLGTVPPEMVSLMADWGLPGMHEELFALHDLSAASEGVDESPVSLPDVPRGCWAGLRTHDMAPVAAVAADVDSGPYRRALGASIGRPVGPVRDELVRAMLERLCRSDAGAVVVDLDDALGLDARAQRPGHRWRRELVASPAHSRRGARRATRTAKRACRARTDRRRGRQTMNPQNGAGADPMANDESGRSADGCPVGELDLHLLFEGTHTRLHESMGAQPRAGGCWFSVWAPNAVAVRVLCEHDAWAEDHWMEPRGDSGVWSTYLEGPEAGDAYHYRVTSAQGSQLDKADPYAAATSLPPATTSRIADLRHDWADEEWMEMRGARIALDAPVSIYEVHLGSWGRTLPGEGRFPTYVELAAPLADHVLAHGFTHVELMPPTEHPFYGSWGYQTTGYFAPTARHGSPKELMEMIDRLHQRGVGVIVDWVPSHFPFDPHGLADFDGTALYEHADPKQGYHPDWNSAVFNYGRNEVRAFLRSSAMCWLERYHVDALRVDAVASMLYLDYSRGPGEWIPNEFGGRENLEAIAFLRGLNEMVYAEHPDVATFAEESTSWPMVSRPTYVGGLGFGFKWDMGWMHDTLQYMHRDTAHRGYHHGEITFRSVYAFSENFTLPLSHDEVVHGKGSILAKMPGDRWQQFANVRLLYGIQWGQPGKKLLFMGQELATPTEWNHESVLDWGLHDAPGHEGVRLWVAELNRVYRDEPAMHQLDSNPEGFAWLVGDDSGHSVFVWARYAVEGRPVVVLANATPGVHHNYRIGVPRAGRWRELANSDDARFGGSGVSCAGPDGIVTVPVDSHGQYQSIVVTVPPLAAVMLAPEQD